MSSNVARSPLSRGLSGSRRSQWRSTALHLVLAEGVEADGTPVRLRLTAATISQDGPS